MKRTAILCCVFLVSVLLIAAEQGDMDKVAAAPETGAPTIMSAGDAVASDPVNYNEAQSLLMMEMKARYYYLAERVENGLAGEREITEIRELCFSYDLPLPQVLQLEENGGHVGNPLDQGAPDCSTPVQITCPFAESGILDGDNDCSPSSASPYSEVFYEFTPTVTAVYAFRVRNFGTGTSAIRLVTGNCCTGTSQVFSSSSVATDCQRNGVLEPATVVTYLADTLTAGVTVWIHVGVSSTTNPVVDYEFELACVPCPTEESATSHSTCETAQTIACNDSIYGDSATSAAGNSDWYVFTLADRDSVKIFCGGREWGHCRSGFYPAFTTGSVDGRYTLYRDGAGCASDSIARIDDHVAPTPYDFVVCSFDAYAGFCLEPGTYRIRVWNYGVQPYVLRVICSDCPPPLDCNTLLPCGTPTETEPNSTCADAANFVTLSCEDGVTQEVYGTICPTTDVDYYSIAAIPAGRAISIQLYQGENCDLQPPVGTALVMRGATGAGGVCSGATGTATNAYLIGQACAETAGGFIGVVRAAGPEGKYKIVVTCVDIAPACPNVEVANQHCSGPCVGWAYDFGPGNVTTNFPLTVPVEYHITDVNVRLNMTHTFDGDVDMFLITPWSDTLELSTDNGSSGDNFQVTVFDDEGANGLITAGTAPFNGSYIPEELLAGADGFNALGTWVLSITDDANGDSGYVLCWCLEFEFDYILAAELNGFDAIPGDGQVEVTWSTASESNNDRFEIVRDGETVAQVEATNQPSGDSYSWTDHDLTNGRTYRYTLMSVDINGAREELATESATPSAGAAVITEYALHQNFPNPFNPQTSITFDLVESGMVSLTVYNLMGQEVAALVNRSMDAGRHVVAFDAANLPSGLYLYKLEANGFSDQKKMLLLK